MKPIEPGCLAVTTGHVNHPENRYKTVRVLYEATDEHEDPPDTVWCVEGAVFCADLEYGRADFLEKHLLRIDGGDAESDESRAESRREVEV